MKEKTPMEALIYAFENLHYKKSEFLFLKEVWLAREKMHLKKAWVAGERNGSLEKFENKAEEYYKATYGTEDLSS